MLPDVYSPSAFNGFHIPSAYLHGFFRHFVERERMYVVTVTDVILTGEDKVQVVRSTVSGILFSIILPR
jgi:hypothetical protein